MTELEFRAARPEEWVQARDLRLEMLADTPIAYLQTLADAEATSDEDWQRRHTDRLATPTTSAVFVAVDPDGVWRAQVATMVNLFSDPVRVWAGAVYVTPTARGQGVAERLVELAEQWTRDLGHDVLFLEVNERNHRAIRYYQRTGWELTGERRPYPLDPSTVELEMRKQL
ncbi:GNAT family N-acetyltransferase [Propionibacteriaceae bacterium Y1923]